MSKVLVKEVDERLFLLRATDKETLYFEALWEIPEGITYNAYVLKTREGAVLFDGWKGSLEGEFLDTLKGVVDLSELAYVVVHHAEPDHSGSLAKLAQAASKPIFLASRFGAELLEALVGIGGSRVAEVGDGQGLELGGERLRFLHTPWVHWPDTIMTYLERRGVLLSGDAFGGYSEPKELYDASPEVVSEYMPFVRKYATTVVGRYRRSVASAIEKVRKVCTELRAILPAHGMLWLREPAKILEYYERWALGEPEKGKVALLCASMYGNAEMATLAAKEELERLGKKVVLLKLSDRGRAPLGDIVSEVSDSEALVVVAPTYEGGLFPLAWLALKLIAEKVPLPKPAIVVTTYGWYDAASAKAKELLAPSGYRVLDLVPVRGAPTERDLERVREAARKLVEATR